MNASTVTAIYGSTASTTQEPTVGTILSLRKIGEVDPILVKKAGLDEEALAHPALILQSDKATRMAVILKITSFGGKNLSQRFPGKKKRAKSRRKNYIPIHPNAAHPDSGELLSLQNKDVCKMPAKTSHVNVQDRYIVDWRLLGPFGNGTLLQLDEKSKKIVTGHLHPKKLKFPSPAPKVQPTVAALAPPQPQPHPLVVVPQALTSPPSQQPVLSSSASRLRSLVYTRELLISMQPPRTHDPYPVVNPKLPFARKELLGSSATTTPVAQPKLKPQKRRYYPGMYTTDNFVSTPGSWPTAQTNKPLVTSQTRPTYYHTTPRSRVDIDSESQHRRPRPYREDTSVLNTCGRLILNLIGITFDYLRQNPVFTTTISIITSQFMMYKYGVYGKLACLLWSGTKGLGGLVVRGIASSASIIASGAWSLAKVCWRGVVKMTVGI